MKLNIALIQTNIHWQNKDANLNNLENKIHQIPNTADLILLPEMFSTGFSMETQTLAETMEGTTINWMKRLAREKNAVIAGSLIIKERDAFFNRLIWMPPDGKLRHYDKRHLFTFAGEDRYYTPGDKRLIVELKGWKIMPLICYDVRFPVWSRNNNEYDLLIYIASFPERRIHAWKSLLVARAIENQCYTIGLNRVGHDGNGIYHSGDSRLVDYEGNILYEKTKEEDIFQASLSLEKQQKFRSALQFLRDRDSFSIDY